MKAVRWFGVVAADIDEGPFDLAADEREGGSSRW
jgi:hypothetical protein